MHAAGVCSTIVRVIMGFFQRLGWPMLFAILLSTELSAAFPYGAPAQAPLGPAITHYDFDVTVGQRAPDCFQKDVILVNGEYHKQIEVTQGNILEVTVYNNLPATWPLVSEGISIHWHGFSMNGAEWYDGVGYLAQCPIQAGTNFTYRFQVNEEPGTYFWHGHSGNEKVDGFSGPLIVRPAGPEPFMYDEERVLYLSDNYHTSATALTFPLNRPFDAKKQTNDSGGWDWVAVPQAILLNSHGFYGDCDLLAGSNTVIPPKCNVTTQWVPPGRSKILPYASGNNPGCKRENVTVEAGKTYRIRMINAGSLAYLTVCFADHNVTIVAADAYPTNPLTVPCVDINLGQRYDVLLKADRPVGNYWLTALVVNSTRTGSPAGYGVLRYAGANESLLPWEPILQPESVPAWTFGTVSKITLPDVYLNPRTVPKGTVLPLNSSSLAPPNNTKTLLVNLTQPLLPNGQLRWALNNVATFGTPSCLPTLDLVRRNLGMMTSMAQSTQLGKIAPDMPEQQIGNALEVPTYLEDGSPSPLAPVAGQEFMLLEVGDVVDVILQNLPANANGGDYRPGVGANRTAQEQHPFHMHGHHFWVLAYGLGTFNEATNRSSFNTDNPPFRDSYTIFKNGWTAIRFKADNPGVWILHCHTDWHLFMGQKMYFATSPQLAQPPPPDLPQCPNTCLYNFGPYTRSYVQSRWGSSGYST
ncbi:g2467 [Coccomyxa elongata]